MRLESDLSALKEAIGKLVCFQLQDRLESIVHIRDAEFRVFSQFGDDGIIQYLVGKARMSPREQNFVEFGTERYTESNTRFLLINNNWSGLVMDPSPEFIDFIRNDDISWRNDLQSVCTFVTPDNINSLLETNGFSQNLGLLSIDIDGMDYWVWKAISVAKPVIIVCEYNSVFGPDAKVTVPYHPEFWRTRAHSSNLYWGCSLNALVDLAQQKGYSFVGSNSAGNNCYFVRNDRLNGLAVLRAREGYVESKFRESRDVDGRLTFLRGKERLAAIADMKVWDIESSSEKTIRSLIQLEP